MSDIHALIVDDEPLARRGIRQLLMPYPDITVVGECRDGREALRALGTLTPTLLFLDVQMPGLSGLDVIRVYGAERMPLIVFVTAHDRFAVQAFEAQALDYLVKPIAEDRFRRMLSRVREHLRLADAVDLAQRLTALLAGAPADPPPNPTLAVPTSKGEFLIRHREIDWIEAMDDHVAIHTGRTTRRLRETLAVLEARLDPAVFARIHRSAIVNLDRVRAWRQSDPRGDVVLVLADGTVLPVSRRRAAKIKAWMRRSAAWEGRLP